jgi:beta-mannanase
MVKRLRGGYMSGFRNVLRKGLVFAACTASLVLPVQGQVIEISGTVTDNGTTAKPITGATVTLIKSKVTSKTDLNGKFTLAFGGTSVNSVNRSLMMTNAIKISSTGFYVFAEKNQSVSISIYNASGKKVFNQTKSIASGLNFINRPQLANGIYVFQAAMENGSFNKRFISSDAGIAYDNKSEAQVQSFNKTNALLADVFLDTLLVTATSYDDVKQAVTNPVQSNIAIKMKPSSNSQIASDPKATSKAQKLLNYLKNTKYISGQTDIPDWERVKSQTGRYPAILGCDFAYIHGSNASGETQRIIDWAKNKKGIVHFQWHWNCPNGPSSTYHGDCNYVNEIDNANSKLNSDIKKVLGELKKMGDAGVVVLFRPLHESNDNYMWWAKKGEDAYKKLYKKIWQTAQTMEVHNLLWDFNGMADPLNYRKNMSVFYPGDEFIDIISSDYYWKKEDLERLKQIGNKNKVYGISETFNPLNPATDAEWSYYIGWASRDWGGMGNFDSRWKTAMSNSKTVSIDQLPDMSNW